ncbi:MAG: folylpolyglutamate synthase/dihydrofolate synthase family protein [Bacteroidales bacterium]|jgi:dihydrofolate synthase/folylpolyglutamate synthase|nr:bifunctional folylpolyglutamate synthase/dihydrofolate synthase [Bacteroidales bacterium]MDD2264035.1 bifunctional folylpolyglutamate synthase/dihydrofolate synthase [Bacteroidales bacterium]MDD2831269.1 bifunctional folylpolyglutamate synthase/dihydrofolate synthase [Bacteroidales bacterium]MDD3208618.1 bifunctional folylpolyglutamate synthase/dihydrofolate synthase [Bacteroidales bacterium]MDD3697181.1 bifunctional folylpolyglutamate synthase/dihydrofolate synthase [Bacteroidales bacterium
MDYNQAVSFLISNFPQYQKIGVAGYKPYPGRMLSLLGWLEDPQEKYPCIHIAGTNGKGSVAHMLAAILQSAGLRTGLYTSPHLIDFRERIKVNGGMIHPAEVASFMERFAEEKMEELKGELPSFFDMTTAMAFHYFAAQKIDVAVIETGLGGRLDSTNVLTARSVILSIITNIGLDHCDLLGDTLEKIAREKAGIIKPGVPVVAGEYDPESFPVIAARAEKLNSPLFRAFERPFESCPLEGDTLYQQKNLKTVLCAVDVLKESKPALAALLTQEAVTYGLEHFESMTRLRGRWEHLAVNPAVIADTGHNAHGMKYLKAQLERESYKRLFFVFGVVQGKDLKSMAPLLPRDAYYFFTQATIPRALPSSRLAEWGRAEGFVGEEAPTVAEAFKKAFEVAAEDDLILVGGSTFTVADLLENFFCRE